MNRNALAALTGLLAVVYGAADTIPILVRFTDSPPRALGMTVGETVVVSLWTARILAFLALPVGALAVGYVSGTDLDERYREVLAALATGGAVGGAAGAVVVAVVADGGGALVIGVLVSTAATAAIGFAVAGFAGAAFAYVRTRGDEHRATAG